MAGIRDRTESKIKYEPASKLNIKVTHAIIVWKHQGSSPKLDAERLLTILYLGGTLLAFLT